jgi:hypothetical protein
MILEERIEHGLDGFMSGLRFVVIVGTWISLFWSFGGKELHYPMIQNQINLGLNLGLPALQPFK